MNILFLTSCQKPIDGWSVVGHNIVKNIENCEISILSSEQKKVFGFGSQRLKSELYDKYKFLVIIYDVLNILFITKKKPELIHCNVEFYAPVALILSKIYRIPYTITAHGTYGVLLPFKYKLYKKSFELANAVITVSNYTKKRMIEEGIKSKFTVILNGVDKKTFFPDLAIKKKNSILFVGNLKPRKGLFFLLNGLKKASKINKDITLLIVGGIDYSSEQYSKVERYIFDNDLKVELLGKVPESNLVDLYRASRLNILPSRSDPFYFEGFGLIHLEAVACGTLTVGTIDSGNEDAINNKNGFLIQYGDVDKLSKIILNVFSSESCKNINIDNIQDWNDVSSQYRETFSRLTE